MSFNVTLLSNKINLKISYSTKNKFESDNYVLTSIEIEQLRLSVRISFETAIFGVFQQLRGPRVRRLASAYHPSGGGYIGKQFMTFNSIMRMAFAPDLHDRIGV